MADPKSKARKTPKQVTKSEIGIQIYLPLGLGVLLFLLIAVLVSINVSPMDANIHQWADISVMMLVIPMFILSFFVLALLILLIVGQAKLLGWIPTQLRKVQAIFLKIALTVFNFSEKVTTPIVTIRSKVSGLRKGLFR